MVADPGGGLPLVYGDYGPILISGCATHVEEEECGVCEDGGPPFIGGTIPNPVWRNSQANISFTGGTPPFIWSAIGTDVSILNNPTTVRTNKLVVGASACGCVGFDVLDACGRQLIIDQPVLPYARVVEGSSYNAYYDAEQTNFTPCPPTTWGSSDSGSCESNCYREADVRGGPWITNGCPQSCLCSNIIIYHSSYGLTGCWFNCTYQPGARALSYCRISISAWGCT
jgi:hypothetical protein